MANKPGLCWIEGRNGFRPFVDFRQIIKGRDKGKIEIVLPATPKRKVLVDPESIKRYPIRSR